MVHHGRFGKLKDVLEVLKTIIDKWNEDRLPQLAAALSYFTFFSLAPVLVISIAIAGLVLGQENVRYDLMGQIQSFVGPDSAQAIGKLLQSANRPESSIPAAILGLLALVGGALGVFGALKGSLNQIWHVPQRKSAGFIKDALQAVRDEFVLFAMVLVVGFLLLISLAASAIFAAIIAYVNSQFGDSLVIAASMGRLIDFLLSFAVTTILFAAIYKILPDIPISWRDVWIGALLTAGLFSLGKYLIGLYLGTSGIATAYGAAGSLIIILLWVNYSCQIFFVGAEFTHIYAVRYGSLAKRTNTTTEISPNPQPSASTQTDRASNSQSGHPSPVS